MIEFAEYTGRFPNLCSGILVLNVDGKEYVFGGKRKNGKLVGFEFGYPYKEPSDYTKDGHLKTGLYESFWSTGGSVWFDDDWCEHVESGEWNISEKSLPEELKQYAEEIKDVFNTHVPYGCCGGCV